MENYFTVKIFFFLGELVCILVSFCHFLLVKILYCDMSSTQHFRTFKLSSKKLCVGE